MSRLIVPAAEAIIGKQFPCLDKGGVELIDYMGGDASVVRAARVSYASDHQPFDVDKDTKLINYLMAHNHSTPFEMVQIQVRMKLPIFVARQWVRHRTASLNEVSGRYTQLSDDFYVPELEDIQAQSKDNKQGRAEDGSFTLADKTQFQTHLETRQREAYDDYDMLIRKGVAKELARINLPLSTYTEWYWCQNLRNMLHLLGLRLDGHAQYEIRVYANALYEIVKAVAPVSLAAWEEHVYGATKFSKTEMEVLRAHLDSQAPMNPSTEELEKRLGSRGATEFLAKIG